MFDEKRNASAEIYFKAGSGFTQNVFGSDRKFWSPAIKQSLGLADGFPPQLNPVIGKSSLPIPAVGFHEAAASLEKNIQQQYKNLRHARPIFHNKIQGNIQKTKLKYTSAKESKRWLAGPNMSYWSTQLKFAGWIATTGCNLSREIFDKDHSALGLSPYVYNFYLFHVYFTVRRILYQMEGIQSISTLPAILLSTSTTTSMTWRRTKEYVLS